MPPPTRCRCSQRHDAASPSEGAPKTAVVAVAVATAVPPSKNAIPKAVKRNVRFVHDVRGGGAIAGRLMIIFLSTILQKNIIIAIDFLYIVQCTECENSIRNHLQPLAFILFHLFFSFSFAPSFQTPYPHCLCPSRRRYEFPNCTDNAATAFNVNVVARRGHAAGETMPFSKFFIFSPVPVSR